MAANYERLESPLRQSIGDALRLIREGAEEMNMLNPSFRIDDDPHGNRIEARRGEDRIFSFRHCLGVRIVLDAYRCAAGRLRHRADAVDEPTPDLRIRSCECE